MPNAPKAIRVTKITFIDPSQAYERARVTIPIARIDTVEGITLSKYKGNSPVAFKASKLTKVNGEYFYIAETYSQVHDMINGYSVDGVLDIDS